MKGNFLASVQDNRKATVAQVANKNLKEVMHCSTQYIDLCGVVGCVVASLY